jgi:pilus assembly protein CpaE
MSQIPTILIVGSDPLLRHEFEAALSGIAEMRALTHHASDYRRGIESARSRHPNLALVEMTRDLRSLHAFAEEMHVVSPGTAVAAIFAADVFGPDVSESAIIIEAIRAGVQDFLRRPLSSADLDQLLGRLVRRSAAASSRLGMIVSFIGNKGGVGKSTMSLSVSCGLAVRHPGRVLLVDSSLQLGSCASSLDLRPTTTLTDAARERRRLDETLLRQLATPHACGLHLLAAPADAIEAVEIDDEIMARILTLARRTYDYVIVDSFPMLDRVMMGVLDMSDRAYIVLESVVPTLLGGAKLLKLLTDLGTPPERFRIILNRYMQFPGNLKPSDVARYLGRDVDYVVPFNKQVVVATNLGRPYILRARRLFGFGRAIRRIINDLEKTTVPRTESESPPSVNGVAHPSQEPSLPLTEETSR